MMNITHGKAYARYTETQQSIVSLISELQDKPPPSAPPEQKPIVPEEPAVFLELSEDIFKKPWDSSLIEDKRNKAQEMNKDDGPIDDSRRLMRLLVAARSQQEVRSVLSEVAKRMLGWHMAAAQGDEKAAAVIRRLNKIMSRGNRKVRDLNKAEAMLRKQKRAEKAEQEHLAKKIKQELERAEKERKQRERKYLNEYDPENKHKGPPRPSLAALEAKINALAHSMAQLSVSPSGTVDIVSDSAELATDATGEAVSVSGDALEA